MEKTKLGISVSLLGALVFLSGYLEITALVLVGGYVLLKEESEKLKRCVMYSLILFLGFLVASIVLEVLGSVLSVFNFNNWMYEMDVMDVIYTIYSVFRSIISSFVSILGIAKIVVFGIFTVGTLMGKELKIAFLDKIVDKFLGKHF